MSAEHESEEGDDYGPFTTPAYSPSYETYRYKEASKRKEREAAEVRIHAAWMRSLYRPDLG